MIRGSKRLAYLRKMAFTELNGEPLKGFKQRREMI